MTTPNRHTARAVRRLPAASVAAIAPLAAAQPQPAGDAELLKKLANPIAALISLPFQYTTTARSGRRAPAAATRWTSSRWSRSSSTRTGT